MLCNGIVDGRTHVGANGAEIVGISSESAFFFRGQTIVAHVLSAARVTRGVEGISHRVLRRHQAPGGFGHLRAVAIGRESTFVEFTAVFEHVFGDFAQIEVQLAGIVRHLSVDFREGVHHPKLHVLHIGGIEVRRFDATHHTAPALCGVTQFAIAVERGIEVIRTAFVGIEGQVEDGKGGRILIV